MLTKKRSKMIWTDIIEKSNRKRNLSKNIMISCEKFLQNSLNIMKADRKFSKDRKIIIEKMERDFLISELRASLNLTGLKKK
jgi:hypothetical protein